MNLAERPGWHTEINRTGISQPGFFFFALLIALCFQILLESALKNHLLVFPVAVLDHVIVPQAQDAAIITLHQGFKRILKDASCVCRQETQFRNPHPKSPFNSSLSYLGSTISKNSKDGPGEVRGFRSLVGEQWVESSIPSTGPPGLHKSKSNRYQQDSHSKMLEKQERGEAPTCKRFGGPDFQQQKRWHQFRFNFA